MLKESKSFTIPVDGEVVCGEIAAPVNPLGTVVTMHGGPGGDRNGPENLFADIEEPLLSLGLAVARFDFRGSGSSAVSPRAATVRGGISDAHAVLNYALEDLPTPVFAIVESMGALMAIASRRLIECQGVALLWPALNLHDTDLRTFLSPTEMARSRQQGGYFDDGFDLGIQFLEDCLQVDVGESLSNLSSSTVVVHGDADDEVPLSHSIRATAILGENATLHVVEGGNHGLKRPHERSFVVRTVIDSFSALLQNAV